MVHFGLDFKRHAATVETDGRGDGAGQDQDQDNAKFERSNDLVILLDELGAE